jgi:hypothetical protein
MSSSFLSSRDRNLQDVFEDAGECGSSFAFALVYRVAVLEASAMGCAYPVDGAPEMADKRFPEQDQQALISELQSVLAFGQTTGIEHETASRLKPPDA